MIQKIFKIVFAAILFLPFSCNDDEPGPAPVDPCLTTQSSLHGSAIDGKYIVSFEATDRSGRRAQETAARLMERYRVADGVEGPIEGEFIHFVMLLSAQQASELSHDPSIAAIEPDRMLSICACIEVIEPRLVTWNAEQVGFGDGTGKTAWVLDTGVDFDHPDLTINRALSRSFVDGVTSAADDNGHGTHIAGVIGAKNNRIGTLGIASGATIVGVKILDANGDGKVSGALKALSYVRSNASMGDVVNISLSLDEISEVLESEIRSTGSRGIYVTIAAGNDNRSADAYSPSRTNGTNIFTVSAVDSLGRFASFSNYGEAIDFAAPGVRILSSYKDGKYAYMSGTSMAAPHVAGLLLVNNGKVNTQGYATGDPDGSPDPLAHQ